MMSSEKKVKPPDEEGSPKKVSFWHVDKEMLRFKIHFFLFIGALAAAVPFIVVFAKARLGLSPSSLGAVLTAQMFLFIFTKPLIGYIADYFNRLKSIIVVLTIITGSCYFLLLAIPKYEQESSSTFNATLCRKYENLLKFRVAEDSFSVEDIHFVKTQNETETCQLCSPYTECAFSVTDLSFLNVSHDHKQQDLDISSERIFVVYCYENESIIISVCSSPGDTFSNNSSTKIFCSNILNVDERGYSLKISSVMNSSALSQNLTETLNLGDYLKISQALNVSMLSLTEELNQCNASKDSAEPRREGSQPKPVSDFQTMQFWIFAFLFSLTSICCNATFTLSDTACCESIQKTGADFGKQRMWGSVGWGLIAPIAGYINDYTGDFLDSWILMAAMLLLFLWNLSKLDLVKPSFSSNILGDVGTVLKSKEFLAFEVVIVMNGVSTGMIWFYLIWFLTSIGGSELLCGLCIAVQCFCGAIPFMFFSGWVIRKIGYFQILSAALLTYVVRFLWYSNLYNPWWVLPVECCHGITYGLYYTVLAHYGKKSAKPGTEATTQSVLFSTHEGLGAGLGCVLAGIGFDYFGGRETFFAASMFCACGFVISIVLFFTVIRQKKVDEDVASSQTRV